MRALGRAIDKFCNKHPRFGIPRLMIYIVFVSAITFVFGGGLITRFAFQPALIFSGEFWRIITWVFIPVNPGTNIFFMAITLYFYYFIGSTLERQWGTAKFTIYYISGILLHIIYGFVAALVFGRAVPLSPMFLNLSMFFAFAVLFPDHTVRLFFIIPIKIKWLALLNAAFFAYTVIMGLTAGSIFMAIMPVVAILNFIVICGGDLLENLRPLKSRVSPQTIKFKKASRQAKRNMANQPYRHKCAVCGKTDTEFPDMEFRYCSRCDGFQCFCSEHINNHIHFQ